MKKLKNTTTSVMERGAICTFDIWLADIPHVENSHVQHGVRPVVVVSNNLANRHSPVISAVPLTSNLDKAALPTHVHLRAPGLARDSLALCEQVTTLDKRVLVRRLGTVEAPFQRAAILHSLAVQLSMVA